MFSNRTLVEERSHATKILAAVAFSTEDQLGGPAPPTGRSCRTRPEALVDLVVACRPDHFQDSDAVVLAAYCRAIVLEKTASAGLVANGYVAADGKPSGWLPILQAATRVISTYSRMLRLNPAGRPSVPSSEPGPTSSTKACRWRPVVSPAPTDKTLTPADQDALTRALAVTRAEDPGRRRQIFNSMLAHKSWQSVAVFAATCAQVVR